MPILWLLLTISSIAYSSNTYAEQPVNHKAYNTERKTGDVKKPPEWFPPLIIKNHDIDPIYKKKKEAAEQREIEDLAAQKGMNAAAQSMDKATQRLARDTTALAEDTAKLRKYTLWMAIASALATVFLAPTLFATIVAARSSRDMLKETRNANTFQLQPWINIGEPTVSYQGMYVNSDDIALFTIDIPISNEGITPVTWIAIEILQAQVDTHRPDKALCSFTTENFKAAGRSMHINAKQKIVHDTPIVLTVSDRQADALPDEECWFVLKFEVRFKDRFTSEGGKHRCLPVTAIRRTDWDIRKTFTRVYIGNETLEVDGDRY